VTVSRLSTARRTLTGDHEPHESVPQEKQHPIQFPMSM
jgi:hypothetical protein